MVSFVNNKFLRHRENVCKMLSVKGSFTPLVMGWSQSMYR